MYGKSGCKRLTFVMSAGVQGQLALEVSLPVPTTQREEEGKFYSAALAFEPYIYLSMALMSTNDSTRSKTLGLKVYPL